MARSNKNACSKMSDEFRIDTTDLLFVHIDLFGKNVRKDTLKYNIRCKN